MDETTRARVEELAVRGRWYDALDLVQDQVEGAIDLGLISREQMRADLELALLVARLDLGAAEYEAWQQAVQWLARLEEQGQGNLEWCRSLALARLYTGAPEEALRLARMGLNLNHQDEICRYLAAVLAAHFGDKAEGIALLEEGLAACPGQRRFADALERLQAVACAAPPKKRCSACWATTRAWQKPPRPSGRRTPSLRASTALRTWPFRAIL